MATAGGVQQDGRSLGSAGHHESITAPRPTVPAPSSAAPVMVVQHPPAPRDQGRHGSIHAGRSGHAELPEPDTAASNHTLVLVFGDCGTCWLTRSSCQYGLPTHGDGRARYSAIDTWPC